MASFLSRLSTSCSICTMCWSHSISAMFVQPRYAKLLKNNALLKQMLASDDDAKNGPVAALT